MLVFQDSLPRWSCGQRAQICIHDTLQCCRYQSTGAISDRKGLDIRESWSAYIPKLAVQTSYTTSSRFCSPHVRWNWRENRFSPSGKTGRSEQFKMWMARRNLDFSFAKTTTNRSFALIASARDAKIKLFSALCWLLVLDGKWRNQITWYSNKLCWRVIIHYEYTHSSFPVSTIDYDNLFWNSCILSNNKKSTRRAPEETKLKRIVHSTYCFL